MSGRKHPRIKDRIGQRFGKLVLLDVVGRNKWKSAIGLFKCDCGAEKELVVGNVLTGATSSCGCSIDGRTKNPAYYSWRGIRQRCYNPNVKAYKNYGGRGITMCQRWQDDFANFLEDMGPKPTPKHSLDRIDNNGNYEPDNCRWATMTEQLNNTRRNRMLSARGKTMSVSDWARETGLTAHCIRHRINVTDDPEETLFGEWTRGPKNRKHKGEA